MLDLFVNINLETFSAFSFCKLYSCIVYYSDMTASQILSKHSNAAPFFAKKMDKKAHRKQKPRKMTYYPPNAGQFTEMPICMGLILSQDLGVQRNMVWEICGGIFTLQIADMAECTG